MMNTMAGNGRDEENRRRWRGLSWVVGRWQGYGEGYGYLVLPDCAISYRDMRERVGLPRTAERCLHAAGVMWGGGSPQTGRQNTVLARFRAT